VKLQNSLKNQSTKRNITSQIFCIGFSAGHDAKLLNEIAKAGTNIGNFIYINNNDAGYKGQMSAAVRDSIGLAGG
jgi:hypothetical protein